MTEPALAETLAPAMTPAEIRLLREAASRAASAVEFGAGGSTLLLLEAVEGPVVSVESDPAWLARLRAHPSCRAALDAGRWLPVHADLGPVGAWGYPADPRRNADGHLYWNAPWALCGEPGLVLVDGRFRVACALAALARVAPGGFVAVHDFWGRGAYRVLLDHAELAATAASLVLLQRRPGAPPPCPEGFGRDPR
ncbi:MAG: hypothetical protein N3D18_07005 [Roseococcus sp.]|nr:hypothetical protein [Roseococcus sp.]